MKAHAPTKAAIMSLIKIVANNEAARFDKSNGQMTVQNGKATRVYKARHETLVWMRQQGLLQFGFDGHITLAKSAANWMRRNNAPEGDVDRFRAQHDSIMQIEVSGPNGLSQKVSVVDPESPLAWLMARKGKDGTPFLSQAHYAAGERLREDYGRAALNPKMGMSWSQSGRSGGSAGRGVGDAHDASLDARDRVNDALSTVGPELAGPLVDVCCYLQSLSVVEKERNWPARSGKLILKLSLEALARHYGLLNEARGAQFASHVRHAGAQDYRPSL